MNFEIEAELIFFIIAIFMFSGICFSLKIMKMAFWYFYTVIVWVFYACCVLAIYSAIRHPKIIQGTIYFLNNWKTIVDHVNKQHFNKQF